MKINIRDFDETIVKMWSEGKTGGMISNEIGFTRNSVISRIAKLRAKKIIDISVLDARMLAIKILAAKGNGKLAPHFNPHPVALRPAFDNQNPSKGGHVGYDGLTSKSCRYVISGDSVSDYLFCGADKAKGSYCLHHHNICYVEHSSLRMKPRRETKW